MFISDVEESLVVDDHVSEGFLVTLSSGDILHIFRHDPGVSGDHEGNTGYIAKRKYSSDVWLPIETVYSSSLYDDRNIHGGITNDGRIVVFFRRYEAVSLVTEGCYFIYSDDEGITWSGLNLMNTNNDLVAYGTGQMFYNPEIEKYCIVGYRPNYLEIRFSVNGSNWDEYVVIANDTSIKLTEIAGAYCGNSRVVVLVRDDERVYGYPLLQIESSDNGQTWSLPKKTNIPPYLHWGGAPQLLFDETHQVLIAMTNDRRSMYEVGGGSKERLYIFYAKPDDILNNPQGWTLTNSFVRPLIDSNSNFYGYPTFTKMKDSDSYLIVFTDRDISNGTEDAAFYQFELMIQKRFKEVEAYERNSQGLRKLNVMENVGSVVSENIVYIVDA